MSFIDFPEYAARGSVDVETTWTLGFIYGPETSVFSIVAVFFYLRYRIDRHRHREIVEALAARKAAVDPAG